MEGKNEKDLQKIIFYSCNIDADIQHAQ